MENNEINKLDMKSADIVSVNIKKIGELFPNVIKEGKIDFKELKQTLSNELIDESKEKYQLTWAGKNEAKLLANQQITKTLRPVKEKSIEFDSTQNIYIEGDNLEALKLLQESYLNKIKCIYIDPPYNTGNDFVYNDNYSKTIDDELLESGQVDEYNNKLVTNNESNGRFHSDWLSMMYPRMKIAKNLLSKEGAIFISIDDCEIDNLKKICDEIFGEENYISTIVVESASTGGVKRTFKDRKFLKTKEYILMYAKNYNDFRLKPIYDAQDILDSHFSIFFDKKEFKPLNQKITELFKGKNVNAKDWLKDKEIKDFILNNDMNIYQTDGHGISDWTNNKDVVHTSLYKDSNVEVFQATLNDKVEIYKTSNGKSNSFAKMQPLSLKTEIIDGKKEISLLRGDLWKDFYKDMGNVTKEGEIIYPNGKKPVRLISDIINSIVDENDIVMDFFSGSGTTAHSCLKVNSEYKKNIKFILVQIPEKIDYSVKQNKDNYQKYGFETICDLGEERIRRSANKIKEETNANIDYGFRVYKVDSSNMKDIYYEPSKLNQTQLNMFESNIKEDRTSEDLLTQVILDLGLTLDLSIEERKILNNKVFFVAGNSLVACFDEQINIDILNQICEVKPLKVVFRESSFRNDSDKINAYERIKKLSPETEISVI